MHGTFKATCLAVIFVAWGALVAPGEAFKAKLTYRLRFEFWDGYNKKAYGRKSLDAKGIKRGDPDDTLLLQRIVFGFQDENWRFLFYDARVWGWSLDQNDFVKNRGKHCELVMDPYEEYLEPFEIFVSFHWPLASGVKLKTILGRQKIWYGDKRIFGPGAWGNAVGWLWDAARFSLRWDHNFLDFWYGQTKAKDPESLSLFSQHAYQGVGLYGHFPWKKANFEPFFAWKNALCYVKGRKDNLFYAGARVAQTHGEGLIYDLTYVREFGHYLVKEGPNLRVKAWAYVVKIGYHLEKLPFSPIFWLGRIYASGDDHPEKGVVKTFTRPFGSTDGEHYGRLDLMTWSNMVDNQIDLRLRLTPKIKLRLAYHNFHLAEENDRWAYFGYRVKGNAYDHIGDEFDLVLRAKWGRHLKIQTFYTHFWPGSFVKKHIAHNEANRFVFQIQYFY